MIKVIKNKGEIQMTKAEFQLEPLTCPSCIKKIESLLAKTEGVKDSRVLFNSSKVKTNFDETIIQAADIQQRIEKLGYEVKSSKVSK